MHKDNCQSRATKSINVPQILIKQELSRLITMLVLHMIKYHNQPQTETLAWVWGNRKWQCYLDDASSFEVVWNVFSQLDLHYLQARKSTARLLGLSIDRFHKSIWLTISWFDSVLIHLDMYQVQYIFLT